MGRNMDARRAVDTWFDKHDIEVATFNESIGRAIRLLMRGCTVKKFAESIHYSRTGLTTLLNQKATDKNQRSWTLSTLIAVAGALGIKLSEFIAAVEAVTEGKTPQLSTRLAGTAPCSGERLQKLVYEAIKYDGDTDANKFDGMLELLYRVKDIEYAVPDFWAGYCSGDISDESALELLNKAAERHLTPGKDAPPFWAALQIEWQNAASN